MFSTVNTDYKGARGLDHSAADSENATVAAQDQPPMNTTGTSASSRDVVILEKFYHTVFGKYRFDFALVDVIEY